jgi:type IX secretion system PorP/SprF family membrane protein
LSIVVRIFLLSFPFWALFPIQAQDIHFTQWMNAPQQYSPASFGAFDQPADHRIIANHRNQWSSVTIPFLTFSAMADSRLWSPIKGFNTMVGMLYDVTGDSRFTTARFQFGGSYELPLKIDSLGVFSIGAVGSFTQRSLSMQDLNFDNQFDGFQYNESLSNNESLSRLSRTYFDMALGASFKYPFGNKTLRIGGSLYNVLEPKQSFFDVDNVRLDQRWNAFGELMIQLDEKWKVAPGFLVSRQATYASNNIGARIFYNLSKAPWYKKELILGGYLRANDAAAILLGYSQENWTGTFSYDVNFSTLTPASNFRGGYELSIIYLFIHSPKRERFKICPDYL